MIRKAESTNSHKYEILVTAKCGFQENWDCYIPDDPHGELEIEIECEGESSLANDLNDCEIDLQDGTLVAFKTVYFNDGYWTNNRRDDAGIVEILSTFETETVPTVEDFQMISEVLAESLIDCCQVTVKGEENTYIEYVDYSRSDYRGERDIIAEVEGSTYLRLNRGEGNVSYKVKLGGIEDV